MTGTTTSFSAPRRVDWTGIGLAVILTLVIILPLLVVGTWAFANVWRYPSIIPQEFGLRYWSQTLARPDVWSALTTSVSLAVSVTIISALICLPAAFAFARLEFPFRSLLFFSFIAGQAFPKFGLLVAIAGIFLSLNLIGNFWGVVLIQLVGTLLFMIWIPVAAFQGVDTIEPGMQFHANGPQGPMSVTVTAVDGDTVTIDGNHPLAGQALHFAIEITDVREATSEELMHGHVHGPGGHHH